MHESQLQLGWNDFWQTKWTDAVSSQQIQASSQPARVIRVERDFDLVSNGSESFLCERRLGQFKKSEEPAVGDWVSIEQTDQNLSTEEENHFITHIFPAKNKIKRRRSSSGELRAQVIASNIDVACVVSGLDTKLNPGRLIRFLIMLLDAEVQPLLVLTKKDTASPKAIAKAKETAQLVDPVLPIAIVDSHTGDGYEEIYSYIEKKGLTSVVLGASGAGKSTLINRLYGEEILKTGAVRKRDKRGKHTTTYKELVVLPGGNIIIDTPGLRSLGLWDADMGVERFFADIVSIGEECYFSSCRHDQEPNCAIKNAINSGAIDASRFALFNSLQVELEDARKHQKKRT